MPIARRQMTTCTRVGSCPQCTSLLSFTALRQRAARGHLRVLAKGSFMATQLDHSASACFSLSGSFDDAVRAHPNRLWKHHVLRQLLHARLHLDAAGPFFN